MLVGIMGGRSRVYEVMHHKRAISLEMMRRLHACFGIPAEKLIKPVRSRRSRRAA
jgi:HTH-type transcriptional regulator/antitoxin HigA